MAQQPERSSSETPLEMGGRRWRWTARVILFMIGAIGIVHEIFSAGDARPILLITDLILIGLIPIDFLLETQALGRFYKNRQGDVDERKSIPGETN